MASDPVRVPDPWAKNLFDGSWAMFAWSGLADGLDGSQYRRALAAWQCHGCPRPTYEWVAEWLERDGEDLLIVFDPDDHADTDPDLYDGEPGTLQPGFPYD